MLYSIITNKLQSLIKRLKKSETCNFFNLFVMIPVNKCFFDNFVWLLEINKPGVGGAPGWEQSPWGGDIGRDGVFGGRPLAGMGSPAHCMVANFTSKSIKLLFHQRRYTVYS